MLGILIAFMCFFSFGAYMVIADFLKLSTYQASKVILSVSKHQKKKVKNFDVWIIDISTKLSKFIKINAYKKRKMITSLKSAQINLSPETYIAKAFVKAGLILLSIIPALLILPIISPIILFLSIAVYFKEIGRAEEAVKKQKEEIEYELPRFASTLTQELKASRDVVFNPTICHRKRTLLSQWVAAENQGLSRQRPNLVCTMTVD